MADLSSGYVGFAGILGRTDKNMHLFKVYSTINMNIYSHASALVGKLLVGGLIVDADGGEIRACMYNSDHITIDDSFTVVILGGIAAIVDRYLNVLESYVYMKNVSVGLSKDISSYAIGGFVGS